MAVTRRRGGVLISSPQTPAQAAEVQSRREQARLNQARKDAASRFRAETARGRETRQSEQTFKTGQLDKSIAANRASAGQASANEMIAAAAKSGKKITPEFVRSVRSAFGGGASTGRTTRSSVPTAEDLAATRQRLAGQQQKFERSRVLRKERQAGQIRTGIKMVSAAPFIPSGAEDAVATILRQAGFDKLPALPQFDTAIQREVRKRIFAATRGAHERGQDERRRGEASGLEDKAQQDIRDLRTDQQRLMSRLDAGFNVNQGILDRLTQQQAAAGGGGLPGDRGAQAAVQGTIDLAAQRRAEAEQLAASGLSSAGSRLDEIGRIPTIGPGVAGAVLGAGVQQPTAQHPDTIPQGDQRAKGPGFLGTLQRPDGMVSTELSISLNVDGREMEIPSLVPTLTPQEIQHLLSGGRPTDEIAQKAMAHAKQRMAQGLSPFAKTGETTNQAAPMPVTERSQGRGQDQELFERLRAQQTGTPLGQPAPTATPAPTPATFQFPGGVAPAGLTPTGGIPTPATPAPVAAAPVADQRALPPDRTATVPPAAAAQAAPQPTEAGVAGLIARIRSANPTLTLQQAAAMAVQQGAPQAMVDPLVASIGQFEAGSATRLSPLQQAGSEFRASRPAPAQGQAGGGFTVPVDPLIAAKIAEFKSTQDTRKTTNELAKAELATIERERGIAQSGPAVSQIQNLVGLHVQAGFKNITHEAAGRLADTLVATIKGMTPQDRAAISQVHSQPGNATVVALDGMITTLNDAVTSSNPLTAPSRLLHADRWKKEIASLQRIRSILTGG